MTLKSITIVENDDGTATVYFVKPERVKVECDDWEQALECAACGVKKE